MRFYILVAFLIALVSSTQGQVDAAPKLPVCEAQLPDFGQPAYNGGVERLITDFEKAAGKPLLPGEKKKVGLKIYADSVPCMATPIPLVRAVIAALERRGFAPENIFLVGLNQLRLRMSGFLPPLSTGKSPFPGHQIYVL